MTSSMFTRAVVLKVWVASRFWESFIHRKLLGEQLNFDSVTDALRIIISVRFLTAPLCCGYWHIHKGGCITYRYV
ncbi:hypothetical protein T11_9357 [Trichinella zimbabwensis]|uniref:Uncharacterized protein n=1 Tax=Trichinella zimbabwensis TaxID=268475 RepID=A0A0V1GN77_9BILA|nr:hypothetical protein T11_5107 [Trichinella zimbabwensis]KRY99701.1 hypothetical protein T11_9357 [Trichinella zimbabwensis]